MPVTYLRFVCPGLSAASGVREGFFQIAFGLLRENDDISLAEATILRQSLDWFNDNLEKPERFWRGRGAHRAHRAVSWFKSDATESVTHAHQLATILRNHGIAVDMIKTHRPGYIVYEDHNQVAALPYKDTPT